MVTSIKSHILIISALGAGSPLFALSSFTAGHGDIGVGFHDGELELHYHFGEEGEAYTIDGATDTAEAEFEPDELKVVVPASSTSTAVASPFDTTPTGAAAGESFFVLPDTFTAGVPYLGFGVEELDPADWDGALTFSLVSVTGPGDFSVYNSDFSAGGPDFLMASADGIDGDDFFTADPDIEVEGHQHFNLGFTEAGTYEVGLSVSGTETGGGLLEDTATFTFEVVPEPASVAALTGVGALLLVVARRRLSQRARA